MSLTEFTYVPQLKWKAGERAAIANFEGNWLRHILPLFRLVPPGEFEADIKVKLSPDQMIKRFGAHLMEVRGRAPVLLDGELLERPESADPKRHSFGPLLERGRLAGAQPIPVFRSTSDKRYLEAVSRFLAWSEMPMACVRLSIHDLEDINDRAELRRIATMVGSNSSRCILLIDAGPIADNAERSFPHLLAYHLSRLISAGDWEQVVFSSTSFPDKPKIPPWNSASFERSDWLVYRKMLEIRKEFSVFPLFSDYGLEFPSYETSGEFSPSAHIRYSTENKYFIFKGKSVKYDEKYANIFKVAANLKSSGIFKGSEYSKGDAYIELLAKADGRTGDASKWRWCATDHHLTLVLRQLEALVGISLEDKVLHIEPDQLKLILS